MYQISYFLSRESKYEQIHNYNNYSDINSVEDC